MGARFAGRTVGSTGGSGGQKNITLVGTVSCGLRPAESVPAEPGCGTAIGQPSGTRSRRRGGPLRRDGVSPRTVIEHARDTDRGTQLRTSRLRAWCSGSVLRYGSRVPVTQHLFGVVGHPVDAASRLAGLQRRLLRGRQGCTARFGCASGLFRESGGASSGQSSPSGGLGCSRRASRPACRMSLRSTSSLGLYERQRRIARLFAGGFRGRGGFRSTVA